MTRYGPPVIQVCEGELRYVGSSADDNIGIGTLLIGKSFSKHFPERDGYSLLLLDGTWVDVYDVNRIMINC